MTAIECFLCLEIKKEFENCIKIGSSEWSEKNVESVIEQHMWPMTSLRSKSQWLCSTCWEILNDFHDFCKRIQDSHECYEYLVKSEYDMEIDQYEVNDFIPDVMVRPDHVLLDEVCLDENNAKIKYHVVKKNFDVVQPETVMINDILPEKTTLPLPIENKNELAQNPLELSATNDGDDTTTEQSRKQFLAKYYRFTCNICQDPCTTFAMLQQHFREVHNQEPYMMCCGKKYTNRNTFGEHIKIHLDPDSLKCKYCFKILKNKRNLIHHIARWHEGNMFYCSVCNRKFLDKSKHDEHKLEHKDMLQDSDNVGDNYDYDFTTENDLRPNSSGHSDDVKVSESNTTLMSNSHQEAAGNETQLDEHFVECPSYDSDDDDNSHGVKQKKKTITTKSAEEYQASNPLTIRGYLSRTFKFKCDICQEPCESFGELKQHFAQDHSDQKPYVICCGEKFRARNTLSEHIKSHLNPDCYKCKYCNKVLKNKRNFLAHIKRWHEDETFSCGICEKSFVYKSEYEEHKACYHLSELRAFEKGDEDYNTSNSVKSTERTGPTCTNSATDEMTKIGEGDFLNLNEIETTKINTADGINHCTRQDKNIEISVQITRCDGDNFLEESTNLEYKTRKIVDTQVEHEMCPSRNKTTPQELMQFDEFLSQHYKFTCHLCDNPDETYENFVKLRQHFTAEHKVEGYVLCCGAKFIRRRALVDHLKGHLDPDYFKCTYCTRVLRDRRGLLHHIAMHEGNIKRCDVCNKKFFDPIKYEDHKLTHIPREKSLENMKLDANAKTDNSDESDDDIPLIYSKSKAQRTQYIRADEENATKLDNKGDKTDDDVNTFKETNPDYTNNIQRQLEHDEFLTKYFKIICPICEEPSKTFETFALLREHFNSVHRQDPYLICCAHKFKKRDTLVQHIKTHLNPNDFTCKICSKILKSKRNLLYHIAACHEGKQFRCDICQKKFVEESSYKYHLKTHKPNDNPHFQCPECHRSYKIKHKLTHHINTSHRHRYARLCDICGIYFRDCNLYSAHMKSKHQESTEKESYPCNVCGRILTAKASLRLHKRTQHPENGSFPYTCPICLKPVATKGLLNYHIRMSHKKLKPHKCAVCGKAYKEAKQLKGHMGIHTGESIYQCNFCPKTFNSTGNRSTHRKKCHPKELEEWKSTFYIKTTTENNSNNNI